MLHKIKVFIRNVFNNDKKKWQLQKLAHEIGYFYVEKNSGMSNKYAYQKAREEIISLGITKLNQTNNKISITLTRRTATDRKKGRKYL